jgi:hypothetical protein
MDVNKNDEEKEVVEVRERVFGELYILLRM